MLTAWAEGQVVVTVSQTAGLQAGDIILSIDGIPAEEVLEAREEMISGSPQLVALRSTASRSP